MKGGARDLMHARSPVYREMWAMAALELQIQRAGLDEAFRYVVKNTTLSMISSAEMVLLMARQRGLDSAGIIAAVSEAKAGSGEPRGGASTHHL